VDWECLIRLFGSGSAAGLADEPLYRYRLHGRSLNADRIGSLRERVQLLERVAQRDDLSASEHAALSRSLARQRASLVLTEAEAALRSRSRNARARALAAARQPEVSLRSRVAAVAAVLAPRLAAKALERREARGGRTRLSRTVPPA
jgi:hypothetical protein